MSTKNTKKWTKIAETTRFWQDVLARIYDHGEDYSTLPRGHHQWFIENGYPVLSAPVIEWPLCLPQSLGELCLELARDRLKDPWNREFSDSWYAFRVTKHGDAYNSYLQREIQSLRRLLYHKNTTIPA